MTITLFQQWMAEIPTLVINSDAVIGSVNNVCITLNNGKITYNEYLILLRAIINQAITIEEKNY